MKFLSALVAASLGLSIGCASAQTGRTFEGHVHDGIEEPAPAPAPRAAPRVREVVIAPYPPAPSIGYVYGGTIGWGDGFTFESNIKWEAPMFEVPYVMQPPCGVRIVPRPSGQRSRC